MMRQRLFILFVLLGLSAYPTTARAGVCDLTVGGSTCTVNDAIFTNVLPVGTYHIDSFLSMNWSNKASSEQGFNTTGTPQYQTQTAEALHTSELTATSINGANYYEFLLDIDEPGSDPKLTLEKLQIFLSPSSSDINSYTTLSGLGAIYDLDAGGNNWVNLNYSLQPGADTGTMIAYIPTSIFTQPGYIYLYSQFGAYSGSSPSYAAGGGVEEWWIKTSQANSDLSFTRVPNPEPASLVLLGSALSILGVRLRKRRRKDTAAI